MTSTTTRRRPADPMAGSVPTLDDPAVGATTPTPTVLSTPAQQDLAVVTTPAPRRRPARSWGWWGDRPSRGTPLGTRPVPPAAPDLRTQGLLASSWLARGLR